MNRSLRSPQRLTGVYSSTSSHLTKLALAHKSLCQSTNLLVFQILWQNSKIIPQRKKWEPHKMFCWETECLNTANLKFRFDYTSKRNILWIITFSLNDNIWVFYLKHSSRYARSSYLLFFWYTHFFLSEKRLPFWKMSLVSSIFVSVTCQKYKKKNPLQKKKSLQCWNLETST